MKVFALMAMLCFSMLAQAAQALQPGDWVSFMNSRTARYDEGKVTRIGEDGLVYFKVMVYTENTAMPEYFKSSAQFLAGEVEESVGLRKGMTVCSARNGDDGEITRVYANGTAQVTFGDFFGKRFLFFKRTEVLTASQISSCQ